MSSPRVSVWRSRFSVLSDAMASPGFVGGLVEYPRVRETPRRV